MNQEPAGDEAAAVAARRTSRCGRGCEDLEELPRGHNPVPL